MVYLSFSPLTDEVFKNYFHFISITEVSDSFCFVQSYEDNGPVIDAVVWHDGDVWRAALDTQDMEEESGLGKLADCTPLTNYRF